MATAVDRLIEALLDGREDLEDAYAGKRALKCSRSPRVRRPRWTSI